jgi:hypothetical protein
VNHAEKIWKNIRRTCEAHGGLAVDVDMASRNLTSGLSMGGDEMEMELVGDLGTPLLSGAEPASPSHAEVVRNRRAMLVSHLSDETRELIRAIQSFQWTEMSGMGRGIRMLTDDELPPSVKCLKARPLRLLTSFRIAIQIPQ